MPYSRYNHHEAEPKWQAIWTKRGIKTSIEWEENTFLGVNTIVPNNICLADLRIYAIGEVLSRYHDKMGSGYSLGSDLITKARQPSCLTAYCGIPRGPLEKLPSDVRELVDSGDLIGAYGTDCARWMLLSDPAKNGLSNWSDHSARSVIRYMQRTWRLLGDLACVIPPPSSVRPDCLDDTAFRVRSATHKFLQLVNERMRRLPLNTMISAIREFSNILTIMVNEIECAVGEDLSFALREAAESLTITLSLVLPHFAEECWERLGNTSLVALADWPLVRSEFLKRDVVRMPVQINGKKYAEFSCHRIWDRVTIEKVVLSLAEVVRTLNGRPPMKVVIVPLRIVNVVV